MSGLDESNIFRLTKYDVCAICGKSEKRYAALEDVAKAAKSANSALIKCIQIYMVHNVLALPEEVEIAHAGLSAALANLEEGEA